MARERVTPKWISWMAGVILSAVSAGAGVGVFVFQSFETQASADRREAHINEVQKTDRERLIRIEDKLDRVIEKLD